MSIRIGIDVGGTFTDAIAIDDRDYSLIGKVKVPTTHTDKTGVAAGIVNALRELLQTHNIDPKDVSFIAHGTTQATNALLEGDVAKVGIVTIGDGIEGLKSKLDTNVGDINIAEGKYIYTLNEYVDCSSSNAKELAEEAINRLAKEGCNVIVSAQAFSVDDPFWENEVSGMASKKGYPSTTTSDVSNLYGLKTRTHTAVINASVMPKIMESVTLTESSVNQIGIKSKLMVMRCDGGVMSTDEVVKRPMLTILSGPAAGVAGALMYEKLTNGVFLEVGGTSTDISCVKNGKVMMRYSEIGGHKTYINSLDVRTLGIGGGSMIQLSNGKITDVGPRSSHLAGLPYEVFTAEEEIVNPVLKTITPFPGDPEYACIECENNKCYSLTLTGAANIAGYVKEGDFAFGNVEAAKKAWKPLADSMGCDVQTCARKVLEITAKTISKTVNEMIEDYQLGLNITTLVGGGGGCCSVVPFLSEYMNLKYKISENASVISTIGAALAMIREVIEKNVINPTNEDILAIRKQAEMLAIKNGAAPETIEVNIEIDNQKDILRATAIGATEMRKKDLNSKKLEESEQIAIAAENMNVDPKEIHTEASTDQMRALVLTEKTKGFLGMGKKTIKKVQLMDDEGIVRHYSDDAEVKQTSVGNCIEDLKDVLDEYTSYDDGGVTLPNILLVIGKRVVELFGMASEKQLFTVASSELSGYGDNLDMIIVVSKKRTGSNL